MLSKKRIILPAIASILSLSGVLWLLKAAVNKSSPFTDALAFQQRLFSAEQGVEISSSTSESNPHALSAPWAPLVLSQCLPGMQPHTAPCLAVRNFAKTDVLHAQELVYPDFAIRLPLFAKDEHRLKWLQLASHISERGVAVGDWLEYRGQHGQNWVLANRIFSNNPPADRWTPNACMSGGAELQGLAPMAADSIEPQRPNHFDQVILAGAPDSYSWQHFENRVTHILLQASSFTSPSEAPPFAVTGRKGSPTVEGLWRAMGFEADHVLHNPGVVSANRMVFSCRAPLIHPWFAMRTLEQLNLDSNWANPDPQLKKKFLYVSRSNGNARNAGRRVLNEEEVLQGLRDYVRHRDKGEDIVLFDQNKFNNVTDLMRFLVREVAVIIGPHGGGLMNHRMASRDTLMIEFTSTAWAGMSNYEETALMRQPYASIVTEPAPGTASDMLINVTDVTDLLNMHFSANASRLTLRPHYQWNAPELHLDEESNSIDRFLTEE